MAARNTVFTPERLPMRDNDKLQLNNEKVHGPFSFLNPTQAHFVPVQSDCDRKTAGSQTSDEAATADEEEHRRRHREQDKERKGAPAEEVPATDVNFKWTSRNNRKGRHAIVVEQSDDPNAPFRTPPPTSEWRQIVHGLWLMLTYYPIWDVSFDVAYVFTIGSVIWVINAFFSFLPDTNPKTLFSGEALYGGGITAFIGATVFEIGSVLLMFEAVNENRAGCFGWAIEQLYGEHASVTRLVPDKKSCTHHHQNKKNFVGQPAEHLRAEENDIPDTTPPGERSWIWWPSMQELKSHYFHDLGFLACSAQMFGATIFWISGLTALPGIYNHLTTNESLNGAYWAPQIIGGSGFVVSGTLFMIETQKHWWLPAPRVLGWHIGLWNLIGGVGFTLCPIFGIVGETRSWGNYQAACSTFWGSWAFLVGSAIQWYESLDKHPVETAKKS